MTLTDETIIGVGALTDEKLLDSLATANRVIAQGQSAKGHCEQELFRRMEQRGATGIPSDRYKCNLILKYDYPTYGLIPLIEVFSTQELATCWTPEHDEPVPQKFNMTKVKPIAKLYGDRALSIVEQAKVEKSRSLDFGEK